MPEDRESVALQGTRINGPRAIATLAARQHGVVSRQQLLAAGLTSKTIKTRLSAGALLPLHRGVYAVGHRALRREGWWMAAVLAAGPGAALSHRSAAALHAIAPTGPTRPEVSTPAQRRVPEIQVHARRPLDARDVATVEGIPVTAMHRTLVDLADVLPTPRLARALGEAERLGRLDVRAIEGALERTRGRRGPGAARLRAALAELRSAGLTLTRSELEDRFLALLDAHDLPRPRTNVQIGAHEVDALWPSARLVVELDGYAFHHDRVAFHRDRRKDNDLADAGYALRRFTHEDVVRRPDDVARRISRALAASPRTPR